jgi:hypothetical protein
MKILFLHGWQSIPGGVKPTHLVQHGHVIINPKLPDDDFGEAVKIAQAEFDGQQPDVVIGSSRGGAVAMNSDWAKLVMLCPAWKKYETARTAKLGTVTRLTDAHSKKWENHEAAMALFLPRSWDDQDDASEGERLDERNVVAGSTA